MKLQNPGDHTDYGLCYWHTLEMEARQKIVKEVYLTAGRKVVEISMRDLTSIGSRAYRDLLLELDLAQPDLGHYTIVGKNKINSSSANSPMARAHPPNIHKFEEAIEKDIVCD